MDPNELMQIILGTGLISVVGSGLITYWATRRLSREERVYERIHETYLSKGLYPIEAALSMYGTALTTALVDLRKEAAHAVKGPNMRERLEVILNEIRARQQISDLIQRNYRVAAEAFPRLITFGMDLYSAAKRTIDIYSRFIRDTTDIDILISQTGNKERLLEGMKAAAVILQQTEVYLERRLRQLDEYIWQKNYQNYSDFLRLKDEPPFVKFTSELKEFLEKLDAFTTAQTKETSLALNRWLSEHEKLEPLKE